MNMYYEMEKKHTCNRWFEYRNDFMYAYVSTIVSHWYVPVNIIYKLGQTKVESLDVLCSYILKLKYKST